MLFGKPPSLRSVQGDMQLDALDVDDDLAIAQGGAATTAFARLQFEDDSPQERRSIEAAVLRYCEFDTLAMLMVVEAWLAWTRQMVEPRRQNCATTSTR